LPLKDHASNHNDIPCTVRAIKAGAVEFLTKPMDPGALMSAVELAFAEDQRSRDRNARTATLHQHFGKLTSRERELDISPSESNVEPMKQLDMRKNVVRSYDCSLAAEVHFL
jgi:FixJ family two-component response regulator